MAELLIRVVDKVNSDDFYLNCQCTKRGDVIVMQPDGGAWGTQDQGWSDWRILALRGLDPADLSGYLAPEQDSDPAHPSKTLQARASKFDLDTFCVNHPLLLVGPTAVNTLTWLADVSRIHAILPCTIALVEALGYQIMKPPIVDPIAVGPSGGVIG